MLLSDLDFNLPDERIAQIPVEPRDSARLLVFDRTTGHVTHSTVREINSFLPSNTVLVANNSRVRNSRLIGHYNTKEVEILVLEKVGAREYDCLLRGKHIPVGACINLDTIMATVQAINTNPSMTTYRLHFAGSEDPEQYFKEHGQTPLPPYIHNTETPGERYQTVYSKEVGSAAAPTAGLHFTPELIDSLKKAGHPWLEVTLHVGLGTFLPLRQEQVENNKLHAEFTTIEPEVAQQLTEAQKNHQPLLAIGTTSTRTLEAHANHGVLLSGTIETDIFIYPGYQFQAVNALLTNFHLPKSSLIALVASFLGNSPTLGPIVLTEEEMIQKAQELYRIAIEQEYRFYSFGDAMLII